MHFTNGLINTPTTLSPPHASDDPPPLIAARALPPLSVDGPVFRTANAAAWTSGFATASGA
ncbi:hypothetical protein KGY14_10170 [Ameyamaea chiangmaiensis]|uniref:Uncharacterized protein n=1 Tax=Ameyamaea chiangmaiensis TaxID=442969 RepID=A0A850PE76_9PROT|nr:hypothetical protein [Ameyamaea chiangmaiensis]MBS4075557.1 hypothetical protein [Ameyamaea chiangmaiensis]NVN40242.1 hypothetical protein [Ameyamaea chiangmaiensis]